MSQTKALTERGERLAQSERPGTLIYANRAMDCSFGNLDFFEKLKADGGGFQGFNMVPVRLLQADIPSDITFKRGQDVQLVDHESGLVRSLKVGTNNTSQPHVLILNLETPPV